MSGCNSRTRRRKMAILHRLQDGLCAHCAEVVEPPPEDGRLLLRDRDPSLDHARPRSKGGMWGIHNLLLAHRKCNIYRGTAPLSDAARQVWRTNLVKLGRDPTIAEVSA